MKTFDLSHNNCAWNKDVASVTGLNDLNLNGSSDANMNEEKIFFASEFVSGTLISSPTHPSVVRTTLFSPPPSSARQKLQESVAKMQSEK